MFCKRCGQPGCLYAYRHPSSTPTVSEPPPPSATPRGQGCGFTKEIRLPHQHKHLGNELLKLNSWGKCSAWIRSPGPRLAQAFLQQARALQRKVTTGLQHKVRDTGTSSQASTAPPSLPPCREAHLPEGWRGGCHSHLSPRFAHARRPAANLQPTAALGWKKQTKAEVTDTLVKGSSILAPRLAACAP